MSAEAHRLLSTAPRREGCPYVLPSPNDPARHLTFGEHYGGWCRVLKAAGVPHVGTHGIRHRSTTDIANSGVPTKVGMKLTGHKTVAMFMHYVHTEDKPVRDAAELVASRRQPSLAHGRPKEWRHEPAQGIRSVTRSAFGAAGRHSGTDRGGAATRRLGVNSELTMLYWRIGQRIHTQVLEGRRADYGEKWC